MSAAIATSTPPRKLLVCAGASEPGPPPWDDVTPQTLKLPLRPPRALALPRHCAPTAVVTTHQKRPESNRDDLSVELPITVTARKHAAGGRARPTPLTAPRPAQPIPAVLQLRKPTAGSGSIDRTPLPLPWLGPTETQLVEAARATTRALAAIRPMETGTRPAWIAIRQRAFLKRSQSLPTKRAKAQAGPHMRQRRDQSPGDAGDMVADQGHDDDVRARASPAPARTCRRTAGRSSSPGSRPPGDAFPGSRRSPRRSRTATSARNIPAA